MRVWAWLLLALVRSLLARLSLRGAFVSLDQDDSPPTIPPQGGKFLSGRGVKGGAITDEA